MKITAAELKQLEGPVNPYKKTRADLSKPTQADKDYLATVKALGQVTASKMAEIMGVKRGVAHWRLSKMRSRGALVSVEGEKNGDEHIFSVA